MSRRRVARYLLAVAIFVLVMPAAAAPSGGLASINSKDLHEWLSYVASDELIGCDGSDSHIFSFMCC